MGIYVKAGIGREKAALLVVIGVQRDGSKCFLALQSVIGKVRSWWASVLWQMKVRGVTSARLFVGDGNLGLMGSGWRNLSSSPRAALLES